LPPDHKGPCPKCGKLGKDCKVTVAVGLVISSSVKKAHKYTKKHPQLTATSIVLTVASPIVGYLLGNPLVALLIGIILAILNLWLTPHVKETITEIMVEIKSRYDKRKGTQEAEVESSTQQQKDYSHKGIYQKLEDIEEGIKSSSQTQKFGILYALGVAFIVLALSYMPALFEHAGIATASFYSINISGFIGLGTFLLVYALQIRRGTKKELEETEMGSKGRKNVKKPKKPKEKKK